MNKGIGQLFHDKKKLKKKKVKQFTVISRDAHLWQTELIYWNVI